MEDTRLQIEVVHSQVIHQTPQCDGGGGGGGGGGGVVGGGGGVCDLTNTIRLITKY